jgi:hypothetical protein
MTGIAGDFDLSRIAFVDLEASGLTSPSYPTEIGWAIVREDGSIESGSCLIKPPAKWTRYSNAWSAASERLTGITMERCSRTETWRHAKPWPAFSMPWPTVTYSA